MAPVPLSEKVSGAISSKFAADELGRVRDLLLQYGIRALEPDVERIRLDVLKLANGEVAKVARWIMLAKKDYREVMMAAEYELADGKIVRKR